MGPKEIKVICYHLKMPSIPSELWIKRYRSVPFYCRVAVPSDPALNIIMEPMYPQIDRCASCYTYHCSLAGELYFTAVAVDNHASTS